ncbi:uncharacterized protein Bfra_008753 [Botrytis fragariae]|uniref:3'-5' exoribonuclease Rv2179c-like domain-containing protein n=1 Tax=Botrytis fragariae TaxID=1964551 RepID=A0A8H6AQN9_9HELO|nr:uncharacterized protein Bfra_008753 [Botrytis fragariae]KAF5871729.1 hypothetical protein Bfra_008753 [Botrytis fragariae]
MLPEELDVHIMVDCELAGHPKLIKPAITQIVQDHVTTQWVEINSPQVLKKSQESTVTFKEALQAFIAWIKSCKESKYETIIESGGRYQWLYFAYETCELMQPVLFWQHKCAIIANYTANKITKRNFRKEADLDRRGQKHDAVQDCLHQIGWLVKGLSASMGKQAISVPFSTSSIPSGSPVHEKPSRKRRLDCEDE